MISLPAPRNTSALASEIKFLVDMATASRIRDWARSRLEPDPHGEGPFGDEYGITTLYFDTAGFEVFHGRGSYGRAKFRVRRYHPGATSSIPAPFSGSGEEVAFLERKLRRATRLTKRRTPIPLDDLRRLDGALDRVWAGSWFHRRVLVRRLQPVCQISYQRLARVALRPTGPIRLTLDEDVRATARTGLHFADDRAEPLLARRFVLELKYRGMLPAVFKQLVEEFTLTPQPVSKYRSTVDALDLTSEGTTPRAAARSGDATYA